MTTTLFSPFNLGTTQLQNRIVMAPMTRSYSKGNIPNDLNVDYYRKRAAGGVGLIITEGTCVDHPAANGYPNVPYMTEDAADGWRKVVDAVHAEGGKIFPQLWHVGSVRKPGLEPDPEVPGFSPSGYVAPGKKRCHVMTEAEITETIDAFGRSAKIAKEVGFDGIEIHGAHSYLIDQFFCPELNERNDQWGGSLENRARFAVEVIKAVRRSVGDLPVGIRYSQWKTHDFDYKLAKTPQELAAFLAPLTAAGLDFYHCSTRRFWEPEFEGSDLNLAGWTQKLSGLPAITVGSVGLDSAFVEKGNAGFSEAQPASIDTLLSRMDKGEFDLVAVGRALIANPDWANQMRDGLTSQLKPYDRDMLKELV